jgi:hypothetical protein
MKRVEGGLKAEHVDGFLGAAFLFAAFLFAAFLFAAFLFAAGEQILTSLINLLEWRL